MTDNDIIKALECCSNLECTVCNKDWSCVDQLDCMCHIMQLSLDLINRQQAEIDKLQHWLDDKCDRCITVERKRAVKEFEERLEPLKKFRSCVNESEYELSVTMQEVDNLKKEMVGEE